MEVVFIKMPVIKWDPERRTWESKEVRFRLDSLMRYSHFELEPFQQKALETSLGIKGDVTKLIYHRHSESTRDYVSMRTEIAIIGLHPSAIDRLLNTEG